MKRFDKILEDIKEIKIQGASNIAIAGIRAYMLKPDKKTAKNILKTRPTEPLMQNALKYLEKSKDKKKAAEKFLLYLKKSDKKISNYGARLIKNNMNIFTHCHSSTVVNILKQAKRKGKRFVVYTTETKPILQGRITAAELAKAKIKVMHVPDTAIEYSLKKCDLFLFGSDAFLKKGVVNKIGTRMFCEIARLYSIPRYSCGISLKYTKKIRLEFRAGRGLWDERHKKIEVLNPYFDIIPRRFISGVVSELGILGYQGFIKQTKKNVKDILKSGKKI